MAAGNKDEMELRNNSDDDTSTTERLPCVRCRCLVIATFVISLIIFIIGVVLIVRSTANDDEDRSTHNDYCGFASGSEGGRLNIFLTEVKQQYFQLHPHKAYHNADGNDLLKYRAFNPTPSNLKTITDRSRSLRAKLDSLKLSVDQLQPQEERAFEQLKHYLKHTFDQPYGVNYYNGDWMMGPNLFCWGPMCDIPRDIDGFLHKFKLRTLRDLAVLRVVLKSHATGINQYIQNMNYGVKAGMVRNIEDCKAGIDSVKQTFTNISAYGGKGVLHSYFVQKALEPEFLSLLTRADQYQWKQNKSLTVNQTIRQDLVNFLGKPIHRLIKYLEEERIRYCVPSSVSSGLASLPLSHVYIDQNRTNNITTKKLPTGEPLSGKKSYEMIMPYFTTTNVTAEEVNAIGHRQLRELYKQALAIARNLTRLTNDSKAIQEFLKLQNSSEYKFHQEAFPENESNANAYNECGSVEKAQKNCPKRWEALQKYWKEARMVVSLLVPKTVPMFYFHGDNITVPVCPVKMVPNFNPSMGVESYRHSDKICSRSAQYLTPFFVKNFRKSYEVWAVTTHETIPGHHTQMQGMTEHFQPVCNNIASWLDRQTFYTAFIEGWGLYAENPLIAHTDIYDLKPMERYGMLRGQIFRALRLIIDTGLHHKGLSRDEALSLVVDNMWENSDIISKEITRYQSAFGQATAYMIGKIHIQKLRKHAEDTLGKKFSLKDFHLQILSQGSAPLDYLTSHVHKYVNCVLDKDLKFCDTIMQRKRSNGDTSFETYNNEYLFNREIHY